MPQLNPYTLVTLLSSVVILAMGVCLFTVSMPHGHQLQNYRISRRLLGVAYTILSVQSIAGVFWDEKMHAEMITPLFQAFLFTFALITLLNLTYLSWKRIFWQLVLIGFIILLIVLNLYILPAPIKALSYAILAAYFCLFAYYVWIFFREYRSYKRRADNLYAGSERSLLRWVSQIFIIAAAIGAIAGMITGNDIVFWLFVVGYTLTYVYLAIRYISYVTLFYRIAPAVTEPENKAVSEREISPENICAAFNQWINDKGFLNSRVSLEMLAREFQTNPT